MLLVKNIAVDDVLTRFGRWFNRGWDAKGYPSRTIESRLEETGLYYPIDDLHNYMKVPKERRTFNEILHEKKPLDFNIVEKILFDPQFPKIIFLIVYAKYFVLSVNGKKITDKDRWECLEINGKQDYYAAIRVAHAIIEEKWESTKKQIVE